MKFSVFTAIALIFISCTNDKKNTEIAKNVASVKSDVLLRTIAKGPYSKAGQNDELTLTVSGKTFSQGIVTFQVIDNSGNEVYCETFPATDLVQPEYKTANSTLKEVHIKEVVEGFFIDYSRSEFVKAGGITDTLTDSGLF